MLPTEPAEQGKTLITLLYLSKYNSNVARVLSGQINKTSLEPFGALFLCITLGQALQLWLRQRRKYKQHGAHVPQAPTAMRLPDRIENKMRNSLHTFALREIQSAILRQM